MDQLRRTPRVEGEWVDRPLGRKLRARCPYPQCETTAEYAAHKHVADLSREGGHVEPVLCVKCKKAFVILAPQQRSG